VVKNCIVKKVKSRPNKLSESFLASGVEMKHESQSRLYWNFIQVHGYVTKDIHVRRD
jgi:hypothetical protein